MIGSVNCITRIEFVLLELLFRFFLSKEKIVNWTLQNGKRFEKIGNRRIGKERIVITF